MKGRETYTVEPVHPPKRRELEGDGSTEVPGAELSSKASSRGGTTGKSSRVLRGASEGVSASRRTRPLYEKIRWGYQSSFGGKGGKNCLVLSSPD